MAAAEGSSATVINVDAAETRARETTPVAAVPPPPPAPAAAKAAPPRTRFFFRTPKAKGGFKRGVFCFDFLLRIFALVACLTAAILMGTAQETLPFFTTLFQLQAEFNDFSAYTFFVIANAVAAGYLLISMPCSILSIVRPRSASPRILLIILDTVMVALTTAAAAAATVIVNIGHHGNNKANWMPYCLQFDDFCDRTDGAVVASFVAAGLFLLMVVVSALALRKR